MFIPFDSVKEGPNELNYTSDFFQFVFPFENIFSVFLGEIFCRTSKVQKYLIL